MTGIAPNDLALAMTIVVGAALYSSVGHAGASAYIALMALFGMPAATMKPTALSLNLLVAALASLRYVRAGQFRWRVLWPFLLTAVPAAFAGGTISLSPVLYRPLVGVVLWLSALRLLFASPTGNERAARDPPIVPSLLIGMIIGLLSGITGTGGGIFLSPVLLLAGWATPQAASGIVAVFILANSAAGLLGNVSAVHNLPPQITVFAAAALAGGVLGTMLGTRLNAHAITRLLGAVLAVAGTKMLGLDLT